MRSYIYSTVFLIALVFVMWSLPVDLKAVGVGGEALPEAAPATPSDKTDKAKAKAPDVNHPMAGIIGKGGNINEKNRRIRGYLKGKYKVRGEYGVSVRGDSYGHGVIKNIYLFGDFTPPGYVKRTDVDEDIRARSRAFLEEEGELLGLNDLENELGGGTLKSVDPDLLSVKP
ncbi:MAG: hypothetical protein KAS88_00815 [Deltaproteobacteria bacterium]|nr:hypothetical protein [Deltaproteobacteria bacterium]